MNSNFEYAHFEDAPAVHREIAQLAAMNYQLSEFEIAHMVKLEPSQVEQILQHWPIREKIRELRATGETFWAATVTRLNEAIDLGLAQLDETLSDPETPVGIKLQIVIALLDRHPSGMFGQPRAEGNAKGA